MASKVVKDPITGRERVVVIMPPEQAGSQTLDEALVTENNQRKVASNFESGGEKKIDSN